MDVKHVNHFLLLHFEYENESDNESSKAGHKNQQEFAKYQEFKK